MSREIKEINEKINFLSQMKSELFDKLRKLKHQETETINTLWSTEAKIIDNIRLQPSIVTEDTTNKQPCETDVFRDPEFMSKSIYDKLNNLEIDSYGIQNNSTCILHEQFQPGSNIKSWKSHTETITAIDFNMPFGTMVTASLDDQVKIWNLLNGECQGLLEGHNASVKCLQLENNIVATGSMDASIKLWNLHPTESYGTFEPLDSFNYINKKAKSSDIVFPFSTNNDKTLKQWDLETGKCVQTLDILWATTQCNNLLPFINNFKSKTFRKEKDYDFVGALQYFDTALASGTSDGIVRLWDLRSGLIIKSLFGHTAPITCLQFDKHHLITGSIDRSIRIWDLRMGSLYDAFAYNNAITSLHFDTKKIVISTNEPVIRIYDRIEDKHWNCGMMPDTNDCGNIVKRIRYKEGYLISGRENGTINIYAC
ncbi:hypothetical protein PCK2_000782 [Pneumocystis canis]|nr:hypothetical protein PCK2_000782 [Pneumocystis canis]